MSTFKEQQQLLVRNQHLLAVWEFIYDHVDTHYISKDGRTVEKALRVPECLVDVVSEDTIEEVLQSISVGPIAALREGIKAIEDQEVVILDKDNNPVASYNNADKREAAKEQGEADPGEEG